MRTRELVERGMDPRIARGVVLSEGFWRRRFDLTTLLYQVTPLDPVTFIVPVVLFIAAAIAVAAPAWRAASWRFALSNESDL